MSSNEKFWVQQILNSVELSEVTCSEVILQATETMNERALRDIPSQAFHTIKKLRGEDGLCNKEQVRLSEVEEYFRNIKWLKEKYKWKVKLKNIDKKQYLIVNYEDEIFEIVEKTWDVCLVYNPIKQVYSVYRLVWTDSNCVVRLVWPSQNIEKMDIDWYYKVHGEDYNSYYYILGELNTNLWNYKNLSKLKRHWNVVFFIWRNYLTEPKEELVIYNWSICKKIQYWYENIAISESWRNLLQINHNLWWKSYTVSLFDLDEMKFIFEWASKVHFDVKLNEHDVIILWNEVSYTISESRKGIASKLIWPKKTKHKITL